jgi:hypothetical protein
MRRRAAVGRISTLAGRLAESDGIVLIWALLIVMVLGITSTSSILIVTSNESSFARDNQSTSALNVAEAGLNAAVSALHASDGTASTLSNTGSLDHGTWSYTATRTQPDPNNSTAYTWTVVSTGVTNGTTHIIQTQLGETMTPTSSTQTTTVTTPASSAYGYGMFLGSPSSNCTTSSTNANTFSASASVTTNTYVAGSLCTSGGSSPLVAEPTGSTGGTVSLYVGNKLESSGNSSPIGLSTAKLKQATVVGGCIDGNHSNAAVTCSKQGNPTSGTGNSGYGSGVWAGIYSSTQNAITKPVIDTNWYTNAEPGPMHGCNNSPTNGANISTYPNDNQTGSQPWSQTKFMQHVIDGDTTRNTSVGSVDILQLVNNWNPLMNSFDCRYYDSSGNLVGRLAWTYPTGGMTSSNPGTLTITGTVFLDANLTFSSSDFAVYQGLGTLYVNGTVTITAGAKICAKPVSGGNCLGNYAPTQNLLELVAVNAGNASPGFNMSGAGTFEGIAFTNGVFNSGNGSAMNGAVLADTATMSGAAKFTSTMNPPPGAPGAASTSTSTTTTSGPAAVAWTSVAGSWEQLK